MPPKTPRTLRIAGIDVQTVDMETVNRAAFIVCAELSPTPYFPDNEQGLCHDGCMRVVIWRPYMPKHVPKICLECSVQRVKGGNA